MQNKKLFCLLLLLTLVGTSSGMRRSLQGKRGKQRRRQRTHATQPRATITRDSESRTLFDIPSSNQGEQWHRWTQKTNIENLAKKMNDAFREKNISVEEILSLARLIIVQTEQLLYLTKLSTEGRILLMTLMRLGVITLNQATRTIEGTNVVRSLAWHQDCASWFMTRENILAREYAIRYLTNELLNFPHVRGEAARRHKHIMIRQTLTLLLGKKIISREEARSIINRNGILTYEMKEFREELLQEVLGEERSY